MLIRIKNFQSIEDCSFEIPEKSFTCIVGPSNIGKSAIRRALECALYNKSESSYIRKGSDECSVEITFEDKSVVKWFRDKKTSYYEINGEKYSKLARGVPDPILDKGFKELAINKDKFSVQVAHQFKNIFLLDQTGSKVTEVLSNLGNLNKIISANKSCMSDLKSKKSLIRVRRDDLTNLKQKIKSFDGLDESQKGVNEIKNILKEIKVSKEKIISLVKLSEKIDVSLEKVNNLKPVKELKVTNLDVDYDILLNIKKLQDKKIKSYEKIKYLEKIKEVDLSSFSLDVDYTKLSEAVKIYSKLEISSRKIKLYRNIPNFNIDLEEVGNLNLKNIKKLKDNLDLSKSKVIKSRQEVDLFQSNLDKLIEEKNLLHKELKVCPLCENKLK